ncbi:MAG: HD domain-containing protein [Promethearchaeota archaeon]
MKDFSRYNKALKYAFINYGNLKRISGDIPYIIHPIRMTSILRAAGFTEFEDEDILIATLFHDLLEDTETSIDEIALQFGNKVASIVKELTKPDQIDKNEWLKSFDKMSKEAKIIKMVDRIDNLLDMDKDYWSIEKQKSYTKQGKIILEKCGNVHSELALKLKNIIGTLRD